MANGRLGLRTRPGLIRSYTETTSGDPDANAFISAAGLTDATQKNAIQQLVVDLKSYGLWTKMKAIYPMIGGTAYTHKWNLKDARDTDAAYRLTFAGGWTHSITGAQPNGTTGYGDMYIKPSDMGQNNAHLSYYSRTDVSENGIEIGAWFGGDGMYLLYRYGSSAFKAFNNSDLNTGSLYTPTNGLLIASRLSSSTVKYYHKGSLIDTSSMTSVSPKTFSLNLAVQNQNVSGRFNYSSKECAFATAGDGLTDIEAADLYTAIQDFQTTLSRQI